MSKYEFVDADEQADRLVQSIAAREQELHDYEVSLENLYHMLEKAEEFVPKFGDADLDNNNLANFRNMVQKDIQHTHNQMAKSQAIYSAYKMHAGKDPQKHAAAKARFKAKKAK